MSLGLPPVSTGLKSIAPFLQRTEELVDREPVVAYWCAYYAAQLGITLKAQDSGSRKLLLNLLDALERLKKEIGPNDAIDIEPASAAYVENFALKVFKTADDEDRAGHASKSTAKKFLAAANFFEVLRVFPKADVSDATESKLKYAKWKAADIAKAFREGRRPTAGPAGSQIDPDQLSSLPPSDQLAPEQQPPTPPRPAPREPSPSKPSSRSPRRSPPAIPPADIVRANRLPILPGQDKHDNEALSPGRWSTTATPGFDLARTPGLDGTDNTTESSDNMHNWHEYVVDLLPRATTHASRNTLKTAWVSTEMEGAASDEEPVEDTALNGDRRRGRVRFSAAEHAEPLPPMHDFASPHFQAQDLSSPPPRVSDLPPGFVPTGIPSYPSPPAPVPATFGSPRLGGTSFVVPPLPGPHSIQTFMPESSSMASAAPPMSAIMSPPPVDPMLVPAYPPPREVELTPKLISKAQRHCRFAMSALDYEDKQHAIKELKAALETLGVSV